ncbi:CACTA transposable element [Cucumis melo var. makuwa]|uniref:CACTA transposable element n=1 Tax=Cucumis melo var. makuwa TaxID=1194695 RepID=A0A5D3DBJ4_CUCMM|nr:CACTA transposable element [Cucumis melo var. makuwa]
MLNDLQVLIEQEEELEERRLDDEMSMNVGVEIDEDRTNIFQDLLNEAHNELYPGCSEFSSLNFLVKLMHVKILNGWSNKSFDMLLELLTATFPMCSSTIPSSFYEARRKLRDLGLGYEIIHTCKYDCVLYWKEFIDLQHFVLHVARLGSDDMRWHRNKRIETDDVLRHSTDTEGWKLFDSEYPDFASDPRNKCMKETNFFMSLLIPGPRSPSREIDVYLQLLIEELKELWTFGVHTYESLTEAYVMNESSTFCSRYLSGIKTRLPRDEQNDDTIIEDEVLELRESANLSDDFFSLVMGPSFDVHCYNGCIMGGLRFHTSELDSRRNTQNGGVMVIEVKNVENDHINVLEIVISHQVDDHIEDDTLCRIDVDPTIVERPVVRHVTDDFIDDVDEHLSHASIVSYRRNNFLERDAMFLKFEDDLDNLAGGSSFVNDNAAQSSSQPHATPTPRRRAQSRLLKLERHVAVNGCISMTIVPE